MPTILKDTLTIDQIAKLMGVSSVSQFSEENINGGSETYGQCYDYLIEEGKTPEEAEEGAMKAESEELDKLIRNYADAVLMVAENLFEKHGLSLVALKRNKSKASCANGGYAVGEPVYRVVPNISWKDAGKQLLLTIHGVGLFEFHSYHEFLLSGPYTPKQAVLHHLSWISSYPKVYSDRSVSMMIESRMK